MKQPTSGQGGLLLLLGGLQFFVQNNILFISVTEHSYRHNSSRRVVLKGNGPSFKAHRGGYLGAVNPVGLFVCLVSSHIQ